MICPYEKICRTIYNIKTECLLYNKQLTGCKLVLDIKNKKLNPFTISLVERVTNKKQVVSKEQIQTFECPRSAANKIKIGYPCPLTDCPFYSNKLLYNCCLIHQQLFFEDYSYLPRRIIEIGKGLSKKEFDYITDIGIYLLRALIILSDYDNTYLWINKEDKTKNNKWFIDNEKDLNICSICSNVYSSEICDCIFNEKLQKSRIRFNRKWKATLKKNNDNLLHDININNMEPSDLSLLLNQEGKLALVRAFLHIIKDKKDNYFRNIPFGFIFYSFHKTFQDENRKIHENLGLNIDLYSSATELFKGGKNGS